MTGDPIPPDVRRFVHRHITSVEQLELLLLLRRTPGRAWTPVTASRELRTAAGSAEMRLSELARAKLIDKSADGFVYRPSREHDRLIDTVASCYASYRTRFVSLIFERPARELEDFADSFRLRRRDA